MDDDTPAASATCRCGHNITYQSDQLYHGTYPWHWAHDDDGSRLCAGAGEQPARPIDAGMLVRCPLTDDESVQAGRRPVDGCGATFIATPDDEGWVDCPNCGLGFDPTHPNSAPQPPATAQPIRQKETA